MRAALLALGGLGTLLLALALGGALLFARALDQPWLKRRVQALALRSAGVEVDYRSARLRWLSGVEVEGLTVAMPGEFRATAPDLLRVDRASVSWSVRSLLGHGPRVGRVAIDGVTLTVVVDERGRTSFDALPPSPPEPVIPLSGQPAAALGGAPPLASLDVGRVDLILVQVEQGRVRARHELRGLALALTTEVAEKGWRARVGLGSPDAPLDLALVRERDGAAAGEARATFWLAVDAAPSQVLASLDARVREQSLFPAIPGDEGLHAEAALRFDPAGGRTEVELHDVRGGDGAAALEASVDVPDRGDPIVRHAQGDVDLARLLRWVPAGLVPATADGARLRFRVESLALAEPARLLDGGELSVDGDVSGLRVRLPAGSLDATAARIAISAREDAAGALHGVGHVRVEEAAYADAETSLRARAADLDLRASGLHPAIDDPASSRGDVTIALDAASLDLRRSGVRAVASGLALRGHALLDGHPPYAATLDAPAARLQVVGAAGETLLDGPAHVGVDVKDATFDAERPAASRGALAARVDLGAIHASLHATKAEDAVDFAFEGAAPDLGVLRPLLPQDLSRAAPWERMGVTARSSGRVDHLGGDRPELAETTDVQIQRPEFAGVSARSLALHLRSRGSAMHQQADADLRFEALALGEAAPEDDHLSLSAEVDRARPSLHLEARSEGRATAKVTASLVFDRARRAVIYDVAGKFSDLAPLAPFAEKVRGLEGFDLSRLEIESSARGALLGVVAGIAEGGAPRFEPHPSRSVAVDGDVDLRVGHFRWARGAVAIAAPTVVWRGEMRISGAQRTLESHLDVESMRLGLGGHEVDLSGISDRTSAVVTGDLADPQAAIHQQGSVRSVVQDLAPGYPIGDVSLGITAERDPDGLVNVKEMKLVNGAGGTALSVSGGIEIGHGRRRLSLTSDVAQDLAPLSSPATSDRFAGRGKLSITARLESPDLARFRARVRLEAEDVHLRLPRAGIDVEAFDGQVPISASFSVGPGGFEIGHDRHVNPYSMLRFSDQHPLLSRAGFISIRSLKTPVGSIAPLVGNLEIDQNVLSLRQFEMGLRGGRVTGQCAVEWNGPASTVELHVRATGVQSSHGEPFDGNVAVAISAADRTVEGRADILRIGPRHLLDLLDLEDPMRVDPAMNRVRGALAFGYPDKLHLVFDHGFASARLELGGLARLISIDEIRGIPMGPIVDKALGPLLDARVRP